MAFVLIIYVLTIKFTEFEYLTSKDHPKTISMKKEAQITLETFIISADRYLQYIVVNTLSKLNLRNTSKDNTHMFLIKCTYFFLECFI